MNAHARLLLVLASAAALGACSGDETPVEFRGRTTARSAAPDRPETPSAAAEPRSDGSAGDGPGVVAGDPTIDVAALTRAVLAVDVDDEGAINRALLGLGAGIPIRDEARARCVADATARLALDERASVRRGAVALLGRMPPGLVFGDPFAAAMLDSDADVRRQAVIGRTRLGVKVHWRQVTALAGDRDAGVRRAVARGLASVQHDEARKTLGRLLLDDEDAVVEAAAAALAASDASDAMPSVLEAARSPRPNVRRAAALVLASTPSPEAFKRLAALTKDPAPSVRKEAVWGLSAVEGDAAVDARRLTEAIAFDAALPGRNERFEALQGLARTETAPDLDRLLAVVDTDRDALLRVMAARTLALRGDARALPALVRFLDTKPGAGVDHDEAAFACTTAERALCEIAGRTTAPRSADEWSRAVPELKERMAKGRSGVAVARLAQFW